MIDFVFDLLIAALPARVPLMLAGVAVLAIAVVIVLIAFAGS